ncbi:MAG: VWA domain-containing protein [Gammaproteobacteria bacterium]|nr:VWA domain-containing protein [Gammaproteobacteria bacterium]
MLISKSRCRPGPISRAQGVVLAGALVSSLLAAGSAQAAGRTMLVLDASGSMWGQIDGVNKITIAREVIGDLLDTLPEGEALGLVAYGHREKGNCADIETPVPAAVGNRDEIRRAVESLNPKGKTPMTDAVRIAAESLRYVEERATVVLVSDGIETCERDPCAVAAELEASGVDFTAHVVGFDVAGDAEAEAQLRCSAQNTGGNYYGAGDADGLRAALGEVAVAVAAEPQYPEIVLTVPESAEVGSEFEVGRNTTVDSRDMILVVPLGAPDDQYDNYVRAQSGNPVLLHAQAEPGRYEVRYVVNSTRDVIARAPIELIEAGVALDAPETVTAGSRFEVSRDRTIRATDFIAIAPPDAKDDDLDNYARARENPVVSLTAPAEPGLYELRYVLDEGRRVIGRRAIEVTEPQVALEAPDVVTAGATFEVSRTATINSNDFVAIAAPDAKESALENYTRARDNLVVTLTAPAEPGLYELRYVLDQAAP